MTRAMLAFPFAVLASTLALPAPKPAKQRPDPTFDAAIPRPAHTGKKPRVIFDVAHHNVLSAERGYQPLARLIQNDGCMIGVNRRKFDTPDLFKTCEVLVIGVALGAEGLRTNGAEKPAFTAAECDAVRDYVKNGGSLLLITDGFPSGFSAQCMGDRFGVRMSKGSTIRDPVFWRESNTVLDHPITLGRDKGERIDSVRTFTGQTLDGPPGSAVLLRFGQGCEEQYRENESLKSVPKKRPISGQAMAIAFAFGKGRVVVLGEGSMLSADIGSAGAKIGMNDSEYGNRQFALNVFRWLTRAF